MSIKSREVIWGGRIMGAAIRAQGARKYAQRAVREADRAEAEAWSIRHGGSYGGPAQPSPTIAQCLNGGLGGANGTAVRTPALRTPAMRQRVGTTCWLGYFRRDWTKPFFTTVADALDRIDGGQA